MRAYIVVLRVEKLPAKKGNAEPLHYWLFESAGKREIPIAKDQ